MLDRASDAGLEVVGVGKIEDLFQGRGLTEAIHTAGDADGMTRTAAALDRVERGIIMTNLVDLDMRYGHRENPQGYADGLAVIDAHLPAITQRLGANDILVMSADHGNDPTDGSTDHTREHVPLLVSAWSAAGIDLGTRAQYSDVAATICEGLDLPMPDRGVSFLREVTR